MPVTTMTFAVAVRKYRAPRTHLLRALTAVILFAAATACSSESTAPVETLVGNWTGSYVSSGTTTSLNMVLLDQAGKVTGNGVFTQGTSPIALTITGTFVSPTVSASISSPGFLTMNFTGDVSGKTLAGALNGSGFANQPITLTRP